MNKLAKAIQYLRARRMWRGETNCTHRYEPSDGSHLRDNHVTVTVCRVYSPSVNHATRGLR